MVVWKEVEYALEEIIEDYEKVNHIISLFQDDKVRYEGLLKIQPSTGTALELGSGPGNYSRMILEKHDGSLVCLDCSDKMLKNARKSYQGLKLNFVRGVFEALPFRENIFNFVTAAFALRDSLDKTRAISEASEAIRSGGNFLLIDIGKPDNRIIQEFMRIFMRYGVSLMGGLVTDYGYRNPWSLLYKTFERLPSNSELISYLDEHLVGVEIEEYLLGAIIILLGNKGL